MKSKPETLQNRIIKETFAKNRMSKALFVQKKIVHGRTDRQTDRHRDSINYIGIMEIRLTGKLHILYKSLIVSLLVVES